MMSQMDSPTVPSSSHMTSINIHGWGYRHLPRENVYCVSEMLVTRTSTEGLWGMYKRSEPIKLLHSVQNHMANVYSSEVCLQTKNFPKISKFFFSKNTPKYDKLSKISNISIKTILELRTKFGKFGNFGNFGHISDRLRTIHNTCSNLIGSESLYILPTEVVEEKKNFGGNGGSNVPIFTSKSGGSIVV